MTEPSDLEIGLQRRDADSYAVDMRFNRPGAEGEVRLISRVPVRFDLNQLRAETLNLASYSGLLTRSLFGESSVVSAFREARSATLALDAPLRVRLFIDPNAPELHSVLWETLRDPTNDSPLFTGANIWFSRYLSSIDWRPVRLRPKAALSALVVIANPLDLSRYQLTPVDVEAELSRAQSALAGIRVHALASGGNANLGTAIENLREGHDILYVVCHGAIIEGEPRLWLEDKTGNADVVSGSNLVLRLSELDQRPRLVVLASCQSGGRGAQSSTADGGALAALGPRLAEAGILSVLAMQGNVSIETVSRFAPVFFHELLRDGQVDRAMAVARGDIFGRHDFWMPVLYMRLRSGRIWYVPGFDDDRESFEKWPALVRYIRQGPCTPILGPGVNETLLGSARDIARRLAEMYHFPMAPHEREDLPHVAQFLAVDQSSTDFPRSELAQSMREDLLRRYAMASDNGLSNASLDELIALFGKRRRDSDPCEPNRVLAQFPCSIYITTNPDNLLEDALVEAGKNPQSELCPWNDEIESLPSVYSSDPNYRPDVQRPLVYHLFGRLRYPESLVLTEDDYFDYLIRATSNKELIPARVRWALADSALLFLGFRLEDWNFRVLFRSIMSQEGGARRKRYAHVAAQINPEEGRTLEPERARRYLDSYFRDARISIYWGTTEDFIRDLVGRLPGATA